MCAAADWPLTRTVLIPRDPRGGGGGRAEALISAFCPSCGARRAAAGCFDDGWVNPCGHVDTWAELRAEIDAQCARPACVLLVGERFWPYCTVECVVLAEIELARAVAALRATHQLLFHGRQSSS